MTYILTSCMSSQTVFSDGCWLGSILEKPIWFPKEYITSHYSDGSIGELLKVNKPQIFDSQVFAGGWARGGENNEGWAVRQVKFGAGSKIVCMWVMGSGLSWILKRGDEEIPIPLLCWILSKIHHHQVFAVTLIEVGQNPKLCTTYF